MIPCIGCRRFFKVKQIGATFEEGMPTASGWGPYKLWNGDLYECEGCGAQIVVGIAHQPLSEHYQPDYAATVAIHRPLCRIDDCPGAFNADKAFVLRSQKAGAAE